jgi:membrane-associated protein
LKTELSSLLSGDDAVVIGCELSHSADKGVGHADTISRGCTSLKYARWRGIPTSERPLRPAAGGLALATAVVFAESGLLIGFFLPGDSLLFISGYLSQQETFPVLPLVLLCFAAAAIAGDQVGYLFGKKVGANLFQRPQSRLFKPEHVSKAQAFFDRHGPKTIVLARFVPIVRTFAPVLAGVGKMRYRTFVVFNVMGGLLWAVGVTTAGYYFGDIDVVKNNIEIAIVGIIAISLLPVAIGFMGQRRAAAAAGSTRAE